MADEQDIPSGIDLRLTADALAWVASADAKRPWRADVRHAIAELVREAGARRVLELGPGPGLLAEAVLGTCAIESYTLFDFSQPMLEMCRQRLGDSPIVRGVLGDYTQPGWTMALAPPYDAIVTMQSMHEIRHKRHLPRIYRELHALVRPGGLLAVSDHMPFDDSARANALLATIDEQHAALAGAGFAQVATRLTLHGLYLITASPA